MKLRVLAVLTGLAVLLANGVASASLLSNISIAGNAEISGAGNAGLPDPSGGVAPVLINLPANPTVLSMSSVTGTVSLNSQGGFNDPDGVVVLGSYGLSLPGASLMNPFGGLSGIKGPGAGYLVGVFETSSVPSGSPPASLDFTVSGTNFTTLSPLLNQIFYIGDGLTGDGTGSVQQFNVPAGATRLFLGISDAPGFNGPAGAYGDNSGSFTATFTVVPEPSSIVLAALAGMTLVAFGRRRGQVCGL
jgi:hypothetical protein